MLSSLLRHFQDTPLPTWREAAREPWRLWPPMIWIASATPATCASRVVVLLRSDHNTHSLTAGDRYVKLASHRKHIIVTAFRRRLRMS
jgi:hypothetical protein